jgi:predicted translin family RNA/ssDNA-binding protein
MYQRDYILRMIEMIGELIKGILGLIKKGEISAAEQSIEYAYLNFLKQDAAFFTNIPIEKLTSSLIQEHNYTIGHLEILAELFYIQAELFYSQNNRKDSLIFYEKYLTLLEFVLKGSKSYSIEKEAKLKLIKDRIDEMRKL